MKSWRFSKPVREQVCPKDQPSNLTIFGFALTLWPLTIAQISLSFVAPYYSVSYGMGLAFIGMVLTIGRSLDVVADIGVAWASDRTKTRWGRRKPWVLAGLLLYVPGTLLLFLPPSSMTATRFVGAVMLFLMSWTMAFIPYLAQGTELSLDTAIKNRVNVAQSIVSLISLLLVFTVPLLLIDARAAPIRSAIAHYASGLIPSTWTDFLRAPAATGAKYYRRSMLVITILAMAPLIVTVPIYLLRVREASVALAKRAASVTSALKNPVFMRFASGYLLVMIGYLGKSSLLPFILTFCLGMPNSYLFFMMLMYMSSLVVTPLWLWLLQRLERLQCVMFAACIEAIGLGILFLTPSDNVGMTALAFVVMGLPGQTLLMVPYLIAADSADYSLWRTGAESRALHISLCSLIVKVGAVFAGVWVWLAGAVGFDPTKIVQSINVLRLIRLIGLGFPALFLLAGVIVMAGFPLNRRRHTAIQRRLARWRGVTG
jgi:GPH family glycoside/pentoside/hexuronide:cation symporter